MENLLCPYCKLPMMETDRIGMGPRGPAHDVCEQEARTKETKEDNTPAAVN